MRRQPVNDSQVLVLNPHPSLEYVMSCHSRHFLISLLILSAIACPVGGAELTMAADPPAGSITNHGAVLWFFVKGVYDSCLAIFPIINSWGRDNERVLVAQYWCWSLIVWASSVAPADTLGSESLVLANLSLLQPCCPALSSSMFAFPLCSHPSYGQKLVSWGKRLRWNCFRMLGFNGETFEVDPRR